MCMVASASASASASVRIKLRHPGRLRGYGYSSFLRAAERRAALARAAAAEGFVPIIKRLSVLYVFDKHKRPDLARKFRADMRWVQALRASGVSGVSRGSRGSSRRKV